ncbi:bifunctional DNA-formamidopyrimidine glycosylase/DNA-(apurinic or apyrimidinic site) lyase [Psychrosphaera sp. 1_MG-2023]|uniref:Formamidopyrimidine-DNA glycosylase n=1 Tax=Psychrosphaera algicola TaxID=3023714 RepID=A0ABT5FFY5_9GAMM|nr:MULTISPECIES: bifunctional DNA-formamidopyrimidine glycosylase/DNA-(apurinic or apyrimidinic site) lyase [unclassified Psychrosphaera]MDC2889506.1 bifunctional DNA-formamidopyrimidine glycosylase/DNA-(apurinic or apyrimidinic site) lyase [Psychrosphaera sp. G1-22]MDO6718183.1 bifunctional DNA-formamidopyrimidine glycosylase/DNA-(apurinic or apyrimidinic site) lyase [Psychrosphaera sp. 1_MG-2023]
MPELPEVEVSRMGIEPHVLDQKVVAVVIRNKQLRWPIPDEVHLLVGSPITAVTRRAKYLMLESEKGSAILHLGMSGKLRIIDKAVPVEKHDHVDIEFENGLVLRLNDPRRFGAFLWQEAGQQHSLLLKLGPEPLTDEFDDKRLFEKSRNKTGPVKNFIMDNHVVVGVGNIYANESLFKAGIDPRRPAGKISKKRYQLLTEKIKETLALAIKQGGTTLKDFTQSDGNPGYFAQELLVYGRGGKACTNCESTLLEVKIGQRATVFCKGCQR